jgi:hypothetical protein
MAAKARRGKVGRRRHGPSARSKRPTVQLPLWSDASPSAAGRSDLSPTSVLLRQSSCRRVLDLIRQVRAFFPELDGTTIKVGFTRSAAGLASPDEPWIWLNPRRLTRHTIAHEFVHLLQARGLVPNGEKSADLHALARDLFLVDDLPYYLTLPRSLKSSGAARPVEIRRLLHQVARDSLAQRQAGHRTYLRWFESEIEMRWKSRSAAEPPEAAAPVQACLF